jgi:Uma2 family endonuclease
LAPIQTTHDVLLIVEVAGSTLRFDREHKLPLYARAGIAEAWLMDVERRLLHVLGTPDPSLGYRTQTTAPPGRQVAVSALPDLMLDVGRLFP